VLWKREKRRRRKSKGESNEVRDATYIARALRKILGFRNFSGSALSFLLSKAGRGSCRALGDVDGKVMGSGSCQLCRR
jgi:hypothetical protein